MKIQIVSICWRWLPMNGKGILIKSRDAVKRSYRNLRPFPGSLCFVLAPSIRPSSFTVGKLVPSVELASDLEGSAAKFTNWIERSPSIIVFKIFIKMFTVFNRKSHVIVLSFITRAFSDKIMQFIVSIENLLHLEWHHFPQYQALEHSLKHLQI